MLKVIIILIGIIIVFIISQLIFWGLISLFKIRKPKEKMIKNMKKGEMGYINYWIATIHEDGNVRLPLSLLVYEKPGVNNSLRIKRIGKNKEDYLIYFDDFKKVNPKHIWTISKKPYSCFNNNKSLETTTLLTQDLPVEIKYILANKSMLTHSF